MSFSDNQPPSKATRPELRLCSKPFERRISHLPSLRKGRLLERLLPRGKLPNLLLRGLRLLQPSTPRVRARPPKSYLQKAKAKGKGKVRMILVGNRKMCDVWSFRRMTRCMIPMIEVKWCGGAALEALKKDDW
jgi:hypothetical protein